MPDAGPSRVERSRRDRAAVLALLHGPDRAGLPLGVLRESATISACDEHAGGRTPGRGTSRRTGLGPRAGASAGRQSAGPRRAARGGAVDAPRGGPDRRSRRARSIRRQRGRAARSVRWAPMQVRTLADHRSKPAVTSRRSRGSGPSSSACTVADRTVRSAWPLIVPWTATCPRDGSFSLACPGSRRMVELSIVWRVASKRMVGTAVRWVIVSRRTPVPETAGSLRP